MPSAVRVTGLRSSFTRVEDAGRRCVERFAKPAKIRRGDGTYVSFLDAELWPDFVDLEQEPLCEALAVDPDVCVELVRKEVVARMAANPNGALASSVTACNCSTKLHPLSERRLALGLRNMTQNPSNERMDSTMSNPCPDWAAKSGAYEALVEAPWFDGLRNLRLDSLAPAALFERLASHPVVSRLSSLCLYSCHAETDAVRTLFSRLRSCVALRVNVYRQSEPFDERLADALIEAGCVPNLMSGDAGDMNWSESALERLSAADFDLKRARARFGDQHGFFFVTWKDPFACSRRPPIGSVRSFPLPPSLSLPLSLPLSPSLPPSLSRTALTQQRSNIRGNYGACLSPLRSAGLRLPAPRIGRAAGPRKRRSNFRAVLQATGARVFATLVIGGALACGDSSRRSSATDAGVADTNVFAPDTQLLNDAARDAPEPQDSAIPDSVDAGAATTNRLRNGSFETWTMAESPNTTPDNWSNCTTGAFGIGVDAAPELCDGELTPMSAFDGVRWARSWSREGVEQSVPTTPGARYRLTFAYCGMISCLGGGTSSEWVVNVDGEELGRTPDVEDTEWRVAEFEFTAADTDATICLRNGGAQSGIDAVSLVEL